jgi:1-acyl-sn-glycerol-3-phosphate acyltransferase
VQYQLSRLVIGPFLYAIGRPKVAGIENVPATGPAILASNHLSIIDSVYLPLMIDRPVVFPAKAEYFAAKGVIGRMWAAYLRSTNQLKMDRDSTRSAQAALEAALELLRAGELFGFYPEGTRSPDGRLYRGRSGIGWLALNSGAPVIPVAMLGTRKMLPPGSAVLRPARIEIRIGKPLEFGHLAGEPPARARRTVADEVMQAIRELSGQEYVHLYASDVKAKLAGGGSAGLAEAPRSFLMAETSRPFGIIPGFRSRPEHRWLPRAGGPYSPGSTRTSGRCSTPSGPEGLPGRAPRRTFPGPAPMAGPAPPGRSAAGRLPP